MVVPAGFLDASVTVPCPGDRFVRGDCNEDGAVNVSDPVCALNWLFAGGAAAASPGHEECGDDPTPDDKLDCAAFAACSP